MAFAKPNITFTGVLTYGSPVTLLCESPWNYKVKWFKVNSAGQRRTLNSSLERSTNLQVQVLNISSLTEKEEGIYLCQLSRAIVNHIAEKMVNIIIKGKARICFFKY